MKTKEDCDDKEKAFIDKMVPKGTEAMTKELKRLESMKDGSMKDEAKAWLSKRISLLKGLTGLPTEGGEL